MPDSDDICRETARRIERDHPNWFVVFGVFSREYVAFLRSHAQKPMRLQNRDPDKLVRDMERLEKSFSLSSGPPGKGGLT